MPIVNVFDFPAGGANGGFVPGESSESVSNDLSDLDLTLIDLTDGWTLEDPDSLINSVTYSDGFNTVTWNALAVGSSNYNWGSGSVIRAPRWYKLLQINSVQITNIDMLLMTTRIQNDPGVNDFNQKVVCGAALSPTSTDPNVLDGNGGVFKKTIFGSPAYGTWQINTETTGLNAALSYSVCNVLRGNNALGTGIYLNSNSSNVVVNSGSRNSNINVSGATGTVNVYIIVGVGPQDNTDTISDGNRQKFKVSYNAVTLNVT